MDSELLYRRGLGVVTRIVASAVREPPAMEPPSSRRVRPVDSDALRAGTGKRLTSASPSLPNGPGAHDECSVCLLHRGAAIAEVYFRDIAEEVAHLKPAAPVPHPYAGTIPLARRGMKIALDAARKVASEPGPEAAIAAKLPAIITDLDKRMNWVANAGEAKDIAKKVTALRQITKVLAGSRFARPDDDEQAECTACQAKRHHHT